MKKILRALLIFLLLTSVSLNLFQWKNQAVKCENIDTQRKANLLYHLWHYGLDRDKDWIPCEFLSNQN